MSDEKSHPVYVDPSTIALQEFHVTLRVSVAAGKYTEAEMKKALGSLRWSDPKGMVTSTMNVTITGVTDVTGK